MSSCFWLPTYIFKKIVYPWEARLQNGWTKQSLPSPYTTSSNVDLSQQEGRGSPKRPAERTSTPAHLKVRDGGHLSGGGTWCKTWGTVRNQLFSPAVDTSRATARRTDGTGFFISDIILKTEGKNVWEQLSICFVNVVMMHRKICFSSLNGALFSFEMQEIFRFFFNLSPIYLNFACFYNH